MIRRLTSADATAFRDIRREALEREPFAFGSSPGEDFAQSVQLRMEYAPAPPFAAGRPELAPPQILDATLQQYERIRQARDDAVARAAARLG